MTLVGRSDVLADQTPAEIAHARIYPGVSVFARSEFVAVTDATITLGNVVPFRARRETERQNPVIEMARSERPTLPLSGANGRKRAVLFVALSCLAHGAVLATFNLPASPRQSVGVEVIAVEVILGDNSNAGLAATQSRSEEAQNTAAAEANSETPVTETTEQPAPEPETDSKSQIIEKEAPERAVKQPEPPKPEPPRPHVTEAKPKPKAPAPKPEARKEKKATTSPVNSIASAASSGAGRGSSESNANYRGMVSAHLRRYQQFPTDAKRQGSQGNPTVSFSLDGNGRVTSARLARSSGVESLDREVVAMANRASPFPPPPDSRPQSFTIPIIFQLR